MVSPNGPLDVHSGFNKGKPSFIFPKGEKTSVCLLYLEYKRDVGDFLLDGTRSLQFDLFPSTNFGYDQYPTGMNRRNKAT